MNKFFRSIQWQPDVEGTHHDVNNIKINIYICFSIVFLQYGNVNDGLLVCFIYNGSKELLDNTNIISAPSNVVVLFQGF